MPHLSSCTWFVLAHYKFIIALCKIFCAKFSQAIFQTKLKFRPKLIKAVAKIKLNLGILVE